MAKVEIKKPIVDEIIECLNGAKSAVLADLQLSRIQLFVRK